MSVKEARDEIDARVAMVAALIRLRRTRSSISTKAPKTEMSAAVVERECARPCAGQHQKTVGDGEVLHEIDHLHDADPLRIALLAKVSETEREEWQAYARKWWMQRDELSFRT